MRKAASLEFDTESESQSELESESQSDACHPRNFVRPNWQLLLVLFSLFLPPSDPLWRQGRGAVFFFIILFSLCHWLLAKIQKQSTNETGEQRSANCSWMCNAPPPRHRFGQLLLFIVYIRRRFFAMLRWCRPDWQIIMRMICNGHRGVVKG